MRLLGYNSPWDAYVVPFTFFFFTLNDPILCQGIGNTTAFFTGEMSFTKVCVTAPYELFIVYCLLSFYQTNKHIRIKFKRR